MWWSSFRIEANSATTRNASKSSHFKSDLKIIILNYQELQRFLDTHTLVSLLLALAQISPFEKWSQTQVSF
jgi:hypothetical protein